jgi:hypothetical protein
LHSVGEEAWHCPVESRLAVSRICPSSTIVGITIIIIIIIIIE